MDYTKLEPMINELRTKQVETMNLLQQFSSKNSKLPSVPQSFKATKKLLEANCYNVVVCGEVKKGKSSLLNAIIGKEILPVNNEIATSQVFRISNSNEESFFLVFSDGSTERISKGELYKYGSQTVVEMHGEPVFKDRDLAYIQINTPVTFLPEGVSLVDTPGLGALYSTHELITTNYLSQANAVLFVLDPEHPITIQEKKFILKALEVTKEIMFVMTKIDMFTPEAWSLQLNRNQALLEGIYQTVNLQAPQIQPISSMSLMEAANETFEDFRQLSLEASKFPQLKEEIIKKIFNGVGILRAKQGLAEQMNLINKYATVITDMIKVCTVDNVAEQQKINERKQNEQKKLQEKWGEQSRQRQEKLEEISIICKSIEGRVAQIINQVRNEVVEAVEDMDDMDEIRAACRNLPIAIKDEISMRWQSATRDVADKVAGVLRGVNSSMQSVGTNALSTDVDSFDTYALSFQEQLGAWRGAAFVGGLGASIASTIGLFSIPLVGPLVGVGLAIASWLVGDFGKGKSEVQQNKRHISSEVVKLINELHSELVHIQQGETFSKVGKFQHTLMKNAKEAIDKFYADCKTQLENELKNIDIQAKADAEKRAKDKKIWEEIKIELQKISVEFNQQKAMLTQISNELNSK